MSLSKLRDMPDHIVIPSCHEGVAGFIRILPDGCLEIEQYDHSAGAEQWFGNDIAWTYKVEVDQVPAFIEMIQADCEVSNENIAKMPLLAQLKALTSFLQTVERWIHCLVESGIKYRSEFDSWA